MLRVAKCGCIPGMRVENDSPTDESSTRTSKSRNCFGHLGAITKHDEYDGPEMQDHLKCAGVGFQIIATTVLPG